jgi:hypothetical protein
MTDRPSDLVLIELALDAARVLDDFVRSVVELAGGELGGGRDVHRNWTQRKLGGWLYGERDIARSFASLHDRDQLLKAAAAADEFVAAVEALGTGEVAASRAHVACVEAGAATLPAVLRLPGLRGSSPELGGLHRQVARVIGILNEARTRALLETLRAARPPEPEP